MKKKTNRKRTTPRAARARTTAPKRTGAFVPPAPSQLLNGRPASLTADEKRLVKTYQRYEAAQREWKDAGETGPDFGKGMLAFHDFTCAAKKLARALSLRAEGGTNSELSDSASEGARRSREP